MEQNTFLEECLELIYIQEAFEDIVNKVKAPARLKSIGTVLKTKDPKLVRKALHFIPTLKLSVAKKIASKRIDNFDKNYKMVNRKITAKMPSEAKEAASLVLGYVYSLRDKLKETGKDVSKLDKIIAQVKQPFYKKYEEEIFAATLIGLIVGSVTYCITVLLPLVTGLIVASGTLIVYATVGLVIFSAIYGVKVIAFGE